MRLKLYYMPEEITPNLYTTGGEFQTEDGQEYKGAYHRYITNEIYTGSTWNSKTSKKLVLLENKVLRDTTYRKLKSRLQTKFISPYPVNRTPSADDYKFGYFDRYFLKKSNTELFIEVDKPQYDLWKSSRIDPALYNGITFRWFISGDVNDVSRAGILYQGVVTKNKKQIQFVQKLYPSSINVLTDPLQFYQDTTYKTPADINA